MGCGSSKATESAVTVPPAQDVAKPVQVVKEVPAPIATAPNTFAVATAKEDGAQTEGEKPLSEEELKEQEAAAVKIQAIARGREDRKAIAEVKELKEKAGGAYSWPGKDAPPVNRDDGQVSETKETEASTIQQDEPESKVLLSELRV